MSIRVAEEGNKRVGDMSAPEITQCVVDIKNWFLRTKCAKYIGNSGSAVADLQRLEKTLDARLPAALKVLLTEVDGGVYFMEKKQLSCRMIADLLPKLEDLNPKLWPRERFIPFCGNEEALLAIDLKTDAVVEWDSDDGVGDTVADNVVQFLESYRNSLLSGRFEFLEDIGVIEKMGASKK
eukprot:gene27036-35745_t